MNKKTSKTSKTPITLIIDGNSVINREFYGMPPLSLDNGLQTNAILGFTNKLIKYTEQFEPDYKAVAFDLPAPTFRHIEYPGYKASRKGMPEELAQQLPYVKKLCAVFGFEILEQEGFEADDIIGTVAKAGEKRGYLTHILTGDRDAFQLISDNISVIYSSTRAAEEYTLGKVLEVYGVEPTRLIDIKALMGDSSDEIPGVLGIGEKTALKLIAEHNTLSELYEKLDAGTAGLAPSVTSKLKANRDNAFMSQRLATICINAPIDLSFLDKLEPTSLDRFALYEMCRDLRFNSIIKKLGLEAAPNNAGQSEQLSLFSDSDIGGTVNDIQYKYMDIAEICTVFKSDKLLFADVRIGDSDGKNTLLVSDGNTHCACEFEDYGGITPLFTGERRIAVRDVKELYVNLKKCAGNTALDPAVFAFDFGIGEYVLNPTKKFIGTFAEFPRLYDEMVKSLSKFELERLYYDIELPLAVILGDMELAGFLVDIDGLAAFGDDLETQIEAIRNEIYKTTGEFNINSPKQLGEVLFDAMGLPHGKKSKLTKNYSTDNDTLTKLLPLHPVIGNILKYRALTKLKSTYCDGLVKLADDNNRIHTSFKQTLTATGRLSSVEPNLQNIPIRTELGREIRKYFIGDRTLIVADYSQIELRVLAHISGDAALINAFRNNLDIHRLTASQIFGVPEANVTSNMRSNAKAVNSGIVYGMGEFTLSEDIGVSMNEARRYIDGYFAKYPGVKNYMDYIAETARETGYVKTLLNRIRYIPELKSPNKNTAAFGERVARNTPIQGSAADIIKLAMIACKRRLKREGLTDTRLILQVHDELIFETACTAVETERIEQIAVIVKEEMENAYKLDVPLTADVAVGTSWYDAKG